MNRKKTFSVNEIALSGIFAAIAIIFGMFASFPFMGGRVYLIGAIIFIIPIFLKWYSALMVTLISVVIADLYTGWISFTWISIIAYTAPVFIIKFCLSLKLKWFYVLGLFISNLYIVAVYYFLEVVVLGGEYAIKDLFATSLQAGICIFAASFLFVFLQPLKILVKT